MGTRDKRSNNEIINCAKIDEIHRECHCFVGYTIFPNEGQPEGKKKFLSDPTT